MPENFNQLDEAARASKMWWRTIHLIFVAAFVIQSVRLVVRLKRDGTPLVVHTHSASYCMLIGVLAKILGSSTAHTFHSPLDRPSASLAFLLPRPDAVIFVSEALRSQFASVGLQARNVAIIPDADDTHRCRPTGTAKPKEARATTTDKANDVTPQH